MTTKVTICYECGHSYQWGLDEINDVNNPTDHCPLCRTLLVGEEEEFGE